MVKMVRSYHDTVLYAMGVGDVLHICEYLRGRVLNLAYYFWFFG